MLVTQPMVDDLILHLRDAVPELQVKFKNESRWMRMVSWLAKPFNPRFLEVTSAHFPTVWFPSKEAYEANPWKTCVVLAHEAVHLWDTKNEGPFWFRWNYAMPQILAVPCFIGFAVGDIVSALAGVPAGWWLYLIQLLIVGAFVLPWPAPRRCTYELRAYAMNVVMYRWRFGHEAAAKYAIDLAFQLRGATYYHMTGSSEFTHVTAELARGRTPQVVQLAVLEWAKKHGLVTG